MARTFNRAPLQVHTPTANERKTYQFNHYEWSGLCDDKSVLTTAPTTFANAQNVYHDREGLLRSRPAIVRDSTAITNVIKVKSFGDYYVFITQLEWFIFHKDEQIGRNQPVGHVFTDDIMVDFVDNRIFVMDNIIFLYFDVDTKTFGNANDLIYIPTTKIYTGATLTDGESENILTTKHKEVYNYTSELGLPSEAFGKQVTCTINGTEVSTTVTRDTPLQISDVAFELPTGAHSGTKFYFAQSSLGHLAYFNTTNRALYFSTDGETFSAIGVLPGTDAILSGPRFSHDGYHVCMCTASDVYLISVLRTEITGDYVYPVFVSMKTIYPSVFPSGSYTSATFDYDEYDNFAGAVSDGSIITVIFVNDTFSQTTTITDSNSLTNSAYDETFDATVSSVKYNTAAAICTSASSNNVYLFGREDYDGTISSLTSPITASQIIDIIFKQDVSFVHGGQINYYRRYNYNGSMIMSKSLGQHYATMSNDGLYVLLDNGLFSVVENNTIPFLVNNVVPISAGKYLYYSKTSAAGPVSVLSNNIKKPFPFTYTSAGQAVHKAFSFIATLSDKYVADGDTLYINEAREDSDGRFLWYLPKLNYKKFNYPITNLHPVSTSEMGIFFEDEIWLASYNSDIGTHVYTKTRLNIGCAAGNDVITSYDGSSTLFMTHRGLVSMGYQDFIASTEQSLTYLSNNIYDMLHQYNDGPIKLYIYDHWVVLYKQNAGDVYLFDSRNGSWWYWLCEHDIHQIYDFLHEPRVLSEGYSHTLSKDNKNYHDSFLQHEEIKWFIKSQPLYLGNPNAYKHVLQVILLFTEYEQEYPCQYVLRTLSYRDSTYKSHAKVTETRIDKIRTKVIRIDSPHLVEFDYCLSSYDTNDVPLSLSGITIKYKVGGDVR